MRSHLSRWLLLFLLALIALATGAFLYAPYLPTLLAEGFPKPEWPARGAFWARSRNALWRRYGEDLDISGIG